MLSRNTLIQYLCGCFVVLFLLIIISRFWPMTRSGAELLATAHLRGRPRNRLLVGI
jgi:hypothetical protein